MKKLLHIAPHLGGGAGKAISGIIKNIKGYKNTIILLENPQEHKYLKICEESKADILVTSNNNKIIEIAEESDLVIFNWWAHPLSVDLIRELGEAETRLFIWSHINGLQYPVLTFDFLNTFDRIMLTSPCSFNNTRFFEEQKRELLLKSDFLYGIGDFHPQDFAYKQNYKIDGKIRIGYIGTLDFAKLNPEFPEICHRIKDRVSNIEFILCGKYTDEFESKYFSKYPDLKECTDFTGYVTNPESYLLSFDVFCYPLNEKNYATTENALLEAMAVGLPIVVLDNPAEREIIGNDVSGYITKSINEFINKTVELCKNQRKREFIGKGAREAVISKYDVKTNVSVLDKALRSSMDQSKTKHNFKAIIGNDIWKNFLYFCGDYRQSIIDLMNGIDKSEKLPDMFYSNSKSSPSQYYNYFKNKNIVKLIEMLECNE